MRILVVVACALAAFLKFQAFWQAPGFERDQRTFYWTESAMHYYMAGKVAKGEALSDVDKRAQYPEGIELSRDIAPAMPYLAGTLYRLLQPQMPLDIFISYLFILYSSLTVVGVFLWANMLFAPRKLPAYAAMFLYAGCAPAFVRSAGAFIKEDLALPLLIVGFYFLFAALKDSGRRGMAARAVAGALLVSVALLTWHFSQFMLLCFSASLLLTIVVNGRINADQRNILSIFTLILALTATFFPMLRATAFVCSPAMAILYAIVAYHYSDNLQKSHRQALTALAFLIPILIYFKSGLAEQSHVFNLVIDKLRFFFVKPEDPMQLSYETRSNWIEDFNSPSLYFLTYTVSKILLLGLIGLALLYQKFRTERAALFIAAYCFIFLVFFTMARRMITIDVIFLCIASGAILTVVNRRLRLAFTALFFMAAGYETWKSFNYYEPNPVAMTLSRMFPGRDLPEVFTVSEHTDLLNWIKVNTNPEEPILASMGFSPVILAYTGRPIIIHSMFDAKVMRDKVQKYTESLYASEETFHEFTNKTGAAYFIYESKNLLLNGPNSERYIAGNLSPGTNSAVYNFQFRPENLKHFHLAYQNTAYRVFRVDQYPPFAKIIPQPIYDEKLVENGNAGQLIASIQNNRNLMVMGFQAGGAGDVDTALKYWEEVKRQAPYTIDIHAQLCLAYMIKRDMNEAYANCTLETQLQPHSPVGLYNQSLFDEQRGNLAQAAADLQAALKIDPRFTKASARLAKLGKTP